MAGEKIIKDNLVTIAEKTQQVFDAGKKSYYDMFWDDFQQNGNRRNYYYAFFSRWEQGAWSDVTFRPKYDIICEGTSPTDIAGMGLFIGCAMTKIEKRIIVRNSKVEGMFNGCKFLREVEGLIVENVGSFKNTFLQCNELVKLPISGEIEADDFNVKDCSRLNNASITSIINALSNTTSGLTVTLSKTAVNNAFTDAEWNTLIATKPDWNISLV